jgi:hypothetical protein
LMMGVDEKDWSEIERKENLDFGEWLKWEN